MRGTFKDSTICKALPLVTQTSVSDFTSAEVFTYVTTGTPGYFSLSNLMSAAVIDSASEHPALTSGIRIFFSGLINFALSAIK